MSMDIDVIKEGINSLIRAGYYKDKEKLLDEIQDYVGGTTSTKNRDGDRIV